MKILYVGVDMAEAKFDGVAWRKDGQRQVDSYTNDADGYRSFADKLEAEQAAEGAHALHLLVEPTAGYQAGLLVFAYRKGWRITLVNPLLVRRWAQGMGKRAKTDVQDALMLAEYGERTQPDPQAEMPADLQALDLMLRRQQDIKELLQGERNRLFNLRNHPHLPEAVRQSLERSIGRLEAEIAQLDEEIAHFVKARPTLRKLRRFLLSIPGVGKQSVLPLLVLLHRFSALTSGKGTSKQLVAFLGLDPTPYQSGRSVRRPSSISKKGDKVGRALLYMAALGGVSGHNPLRAFYRTLLDRGKPKKVALVAAARKILVWAWAVFSSNSPFDPALHPIP